MGVRTDDLTQDMCNLQDTLLLPLFKRLLEAGVEDEHLQDVGRTFTEGMFRLTRIICTSAGIVLVEEEEMPND